MSDDSMDDVILVTAHHAEDVLPSEKIPELDNGESVVISDDPEGPFRMLVTMSDWVSATHSVARKNDQP